MPTKILRRLGNDDKGNPFMEKPRQGVARRRKRATGELGGGYSGDMRTNRRLRNALENADLGGSREREMRKRQGKRFRT